MKVVLDTNIFVAGLSTFSNQHWVVEAFMEERFDLVVSHDILLEYEEKLLEKYNPSTVYYFLKLIEKSVNVQYVHVYFHWKLLNKDADDNKFADAAFASSADYLVSEDAGFRVLKRLDFPKITVLKLNEFKDLLGF
ncbi:MAG: putative toxin-antitoxin system toxin component, PIN family [Saprospiraceae bacterium]|nr:putative toxin-antitoxin system toxin component, PIN family [Saprospiraceae bacterium]